MVKIFALFAILAFAAAIPSDQVSPEDDLVQVGVTAAEDAKATVDALMKSGKDQGACADLAASTIKEVNDSVDAQQKILDSLDTGADCGKQGQGPVDAANQAITDAQKAKSDADSGLASAHSAPVQFAAVPLDNLSEGQCSVFFDDVAYTAAKQTLDAAQKAADEAAGAVTAAQSALTAAQDEQAKAIENCRCAAKKGLENAWEAATANNDSNQKAYAKGKHMECVLAGTSPAECQVGDIPAVTKPNLDADAMAVDTKSESCNRGPTPAPAPYMETEFAKTQCPAGYERILDKDECGQAYEAIAGKANIPRVSCWAGHPKGCFSHGTHNRNAIFLNTCGKTSGSTHGDTVTVCKQQ